jgi:hypothetical protein
MASGYILINLVYFPNETDFYVFLSINTKTLLLMKGVFIFNTQACQTFGVWFTLI